MSGRVYWAEAAWVDGRWQRQVRLCVDAQGHWARIEPGAPADGSQRLAGPVIPSLVDTHSHAFQRAFAGLAERRDGADDFWSWRDRMYGLALRLTPAQMQTIAAQLYVELLKGGYTQVCEFHYLHHQPSGLPYGRPQGWTAPSPPPEGDKEAWGGPAFPYAEDELAMSWALAEAAEAAGLGLTLLPVLYARSGFGQPGLREDQRRFATDAAWVDAAQRRIAAAGRPLVNAGVALHSLRAANPDDIRALCERVGERDIPIHIHIAEQQQEVRDCIAHTGRRPIEWLMNAEARPDARWHLVHATHATREEIAGVARAGASVVICPGTEGNLGDGLIDLPGWLAAGVPISIGSDSNVTRAWPEELRWLEYGQRLALQQRNVAADPPREPATAARLFEAARRGSAAPAGFARWGLEPGARADFLVLDEQADGLLGLPTPHLLDGLMFAAPGPGALRDVFVAGRQVLAQGRHAQEAPIAAAFAALMQQLWSQ